MTDKPHAADDQLPVRLVGYSDLESAYDDPARVGALAARIDALRDDRTVVAGAGDDTALGTLALLTDEGRGQAMPFLEAVAPDADTFGNHDFDFGPDWAAEWADRAPPTYCCANVDLPGTPDGTVVELDGARVGVAGVAHPETADICGTVSALAFRDPVPAAREALAALGPVDYRVVLSHCGARDPDVAAGVDADAVLGGHLHDRHVEQADGTLLVRTPGGGTELAEVTLGPDPAVTFHDVTPGDPVDDDVLLAYRRRREDLGVDEVVAHVEGELPRTERERFRGESRLGNFAADAVRAACGTAASGEGTAGRGPAFAADVGLFPGGSLRTGAPLSGDVTMGEVVSLCPFGGPVVEVELDGARLRAVLEAAARPQPGNRGWVQFHVSGLRVVWTDANELAAATVGGEALDPAATYRVAVPLYLVDIDAFPPLNRDRAVADHAEQWRALLGHARNGGLNDAALEGRIERVPAGTVAD